MQPEAENPKKTRREVILIVLTALALLVSAGTYWETHRMVSHGDEKDRPRLKITSARASRQGDQFVNVLLMIENQGESSATLKQISSRPLTGSVTNSSENQECYKELGNAQDFPNPGGEAPDELLKGRSRPIVVLIQLPPHCVGRINDLVAKINLDYADRFHNAYQQHEPLNTAIQP